MNETKNKNGQALKCSSVRVFKDGCVSFKGEICKFKLFFPTYGEDRFVSEMQKHFGFCEKGIPTVF